MEQILYSHIPFLIWTIDDGKLGRPKKREQIIKSRKNGIKLPILYYKPYYSSV
jgi:hypothetical protein